ncbi:hypothetical protein Acr_08g0001920 [Actinidia rufa]|uniref:Uncharacterized protein n=1 Tax=Actinidia rufa TaxID=165716 RepID=A0A7J0F005_9ERIC|nr:hypothetical protein Acr_08g0001920 [Actinidia rufa]
MTEVKETSRFRKAATAYDSVEVGGEELDYGGRDDKVLGDGGDAMAVGGRGEGEIDGAGIADGGRETAAATEGGREDADGGDVAGVTN